uniref:MATH domain-containing protein n=1 Tax=Oryza meridionalis TaxID=40149 RepID=A0A0E0EJA1_9ORYZ
MGSKKRMSTRYAKKHEEATLKFDVVGYSLNEGMAAGEFIQSPAFAVGGYDWAIRFYPNGVTVTIQRLTSVSLELLSKNCKVQAAYDLRFVNHATGLRESVSSRSEPGMFSNIRCPKPQRSNPMQRYRLEKEESGYIKDDCLKIECVLTVVHKPIVSNAKGRSEIEAELYGGMKEREARSVAVDNIQPDVFRALLHFMYTDSLPDMDDVEDADYVEMIRLLLVAADRYAMDRMKLLCESILDDLLDAETVGTTLALADQHSCNNLKDVCVKFMATSKGMDAVMATEGYANLKRNCPYVLIDVLEKAKLIL